MSKRAGASSRTALSQLRELKACIRAVSQLMQEIAKPSPDGERCRSYFDKTMRNEEPVVPLGLYIKAQIHRHQGMLSLKATPLVLKLAHLHNTFCNMTLAFLPDAPHICAMTL